MLLEIHLKVTTNTFRSQADLGREIGERAFLALVECAENLTFNVVEAQRHDAKSVFELEPIPTVKLLLLGASQIVLDVTRHLLSSTGIATENRGHLLENCHVALELEVFQVQHHNLTQLIESVFLKVNAVTTINKSVKQLVRFGGGEHERLATEIEIQSHVLVVNGIEVILVGVDGG